MNRRRAILLVGIAAAIGLAPAPVDAARDPARVVLQLTDLPAGFTAAGSRSRSNRVTAAENGVSVALLESWGRTGGFEAVYERDVDPTDPPRGPATVTANVSIYRSGTGLRKAFSRSAGAIETSGAPNAVFRRLTISARIGDETRVYRARFIQDGVPVVLFNVVWRTKGALGHLSVAGVRGNLTVEDAIALARQQQARMAGHVSPAPRDSGPAL